MRLPVWTICDRCGFKYARTKMRRESNGVVVCFRCYDGDFDKQRHPQNFSAVPKQNPRVVPGGRPNVTTDLYLLTEASEYLFTEDSELIEVTGKTWSPFQSVGY